MKLHPCSFGVALGIVMGVYVLGFTWLALATGYGFDFLKMWEPLHPGYSITFLGGLVGFVYCFVEGLVWGFIFAHVYNFICCHCCGKKCEAKS